MKNLFLILFALALIPSLAKAEPYTYAPDNCDMQITFPEKPFIEKKCLTSGEKKDCTDIVTYKKIIPPDASVNFRVTCVGYDKKELDTYTNEVVEKTLNKLMKDQGMEAYDVSSDDADGIRRATSMSVGTKDDVPYIYSGQIWIGEKSMFTLEAQMKGAKNDEIDKTFASILRDTYPKKLKVEKPDQKEK